MSKDLVVIALGVLVALMPFLGFPRSWDTVFFVLAGIAIAVLTFMLRGEFLKRGHIASDNAPASDVYVENGVHKATAAHSPQPPSSPGSVHGTRRGA